LLVASPAAGRSDLRRRIAVAKVFSPTPENMDDCIRLAAPRVQRMSVETEHEAIELLAGLLADAATRGVVMPSTFVREKRGAMPSARPQVKTPGSPRGAAKRRPARAVTKVGE
jgi:hypothetical protein